jgi:hypothetical protein
MKKLTLLLLITLVAFCVDSSIRPYTMLASRESVGSYSTSSWSLLTDGTTLPASGGHPGQIRGEHSGDAMNSPGERSMRGICYSAPDGADSNDGRSWEEAKDSVMGCYDSMNGDGGTIYFRDGNITGDSKLVRACRPGDPPGCGIWIMGRNDPNLAHPPPGWRLSKRAGINFVGVGGANFGANSHDGPKVGVAAGGNRHNLPSIWLSSVNNITFANMNLYTSARPVVVGEDSNGKRDGSGSCSSITFTNVDPNIFNAAGNGPGFDITGNSFWIWIKNSLATGFYANPVTANNRAAILLDGTGGFGVGLVFISDTNVNGGGVKYVPGTNPGSLVVRNLTIEGDFSHDIPPAVWMSGSGTANGTTLLADTVVVADAGRSGAPAVKIDGGLADNSTIIGAIGAGQGGRNVEGPATIVSQFQSLHLGPSNDSESPLRQGQAGFIFGHVIGQHDSARRAFAPTAIRFKNIVSQQSSSWTATEFGGKTTYSRGIQAPDGTTNAARASNAGSALKEMIYFFDQNQRISVGDWYVGGAWVRSQTANGYAQSNTQGLVFGLINQGNSGTGRQSSAINRGDGEWEWQWIAEKIVSNSTAPARIVFGTAFDGTHAIEAYAPILVHIPAGTLSDNEAYELAINLQSYPDTATPGEISTLRSQQLSIGGTSPFFAKLTHSCKADCTQNFPDAAGPNDLAASNLQQTWTQPQNFSSGSKFGSGTLLSRYARLSAALSPASVAPHICASQTFAVKGVLPQDILIGVNKPTDQLGLMVSPGHIIALGKATLNFCNETGSPISPTGNETYNFVVVQ